jgi:hypothetical protein
MKRALLALVLAASPLLAEDSHWFVSIPPVTVGPVPGRRRTVSWKGG